MGGSQQTPARRVVKTEAQIKREIRAYLQEIGAWAFPVQSLGYGVRGIPDIVGCIHGQLFALEVKTETGQPTKFQLAQIEDCRRAGGYAAVVRSVEDVRRLLFPSGAP
jgi:Holliday junction resolvase